MSPSIAKWYEKEYGLSSVIVLRNTPESSKVICRNRVFNDIFHIPENDLIFIYQGVINTGRGIELLNKVFSQVSFEKHLVVMGYGPLVGIVKEAAESTPNIHFLPAVSPQEIAHYTSGADVGLCMIENVSLSYYYCLPNKLFEYLHNGLPVIVSNFPDMVSIVKGFDCGWISDLSTEQLIILVNSISADALKEKRRGVMQARTEINWEKESELLIQAFPHIRKYDYSF